MRQAIKAFQALAAAALFLAFHSAAAETHRVPGTKSGFLTTPDGVRIHYLEAGKGPAILFVPGWTMPAWIWEKQIAHFSKTHRVVAIDPRSQGESSQTTDGHYPAARARDIKAVVDQLKLAPVVLVGWSMGVNELAAYVDQFGTNTVAALVLVDGHAGMDLNAPNTTAMLAFMGTTMKNRKESTLNFVRFTFKNPSILKDEVYLQRVAESSLRTPTNTAAALFLGSLTTDNRPALAKIDKPTLITVAASPWMPIYEDLHQRIPGSRLEVFEGAGHGLFVDEPERFNTLLGDFLRMLPPTSSADK
jgi:microsomal epoxide hydrolase